jgi:hypothetical protein
MTWLAGLRARSPPRPCRCRTVIPLLAGIGRGGPGRSCDPGTGQKKGTPQSGQIRSESTPDRRNRSWRQSTQNRRNDTLTDP